MFSPQAPAPKTVEIKRKLDTYTLKRSNSAIIVDIYLFSDTLIFPDTFLIAFCSFSLFTAPTIAPPTKCPKWGCFLTPPHTKPHPVLKLPNYEPKPKSICLQVVSRLCLIAFGLSALVFGQSPAHGRPAALALAVAMINRWDWLCVSMKREWRPQSRQSC